MKDAVPSVLCVSADRLTGELKRGEEPSNLTESHSLEEREKFGSLPT
jgi:hypothetical protein